MSILHYGNRSVRNLIYTGLLSADRRLPYISDNEGVGTSINFIKTVAVIAGHTLTLYDTSVRACAQ